MSFQDAVFRASNLPITHFVCRAKWYDSRRGAAAKEPHEGQLYLKNANAGKLARSILQKSNTLRYCFLELAGQEMSYWQIDRQDGVSGEARELSSDMALAVMGEPF